MKQLIFALTLICVSLPAQTISGGGNGNGGSSGGGMVLLGVYNASNSSELDVVSRNATGQTGSIFQSDYDEYDIEFQNFTMSTALILQIQMSTNSGTSYDTGTNYGWEEGVFGGGQVGNGAAASIQLCDAGLSLSSPNSYSASGRFFNPAGGTFYKTFQSLSTEGTAVGRLIFGTWKSATAATNFRLLASTGNFPTGSIRVYGIAKQ